MATLEPPLNRLLSLGIFLMYGGGRSSGLVQIVDSADSKIMMVLEVPSGMVAMVHLPNNFSNAR